ncbi:MAG TPA: DNA-formamidopyrimidine glycosylase [Flexilinea sp.]|nr:DNA-formamidopyrimidine glycosylase [Flexilinea sp.]
MPELPEVETFVRSLKYGGMTGNSIINRQIASADLFWNRTLAGSDAAEGFLEWFPGKTVRDVSRRGKFILISVPPKTLLIHLRMSGDLKVTEASTAEICKHDRFRLTFTDGDRLVFSDPRKFGRIWLTASPEAVLGSLGIEPLDDSFTPEWLYDKLHASNRMIKSVLLDQRVIAGLGNIYSDEALFSAGIHPARAACSLSTEEVARLVQAIQTVLRDGIQYNGASIDWVYRGGSFQHHFKIYGRTGEPCLICGTKIEKTTISQRGTHFCPCCQPRMEKN